MTDAQKARLEDIRRLAEKEIFDPDGDLARFLLTVIDAQGHTLVEQGKRLREVELLQQVDTVKPWKEGPP